MENIVALKDLRENMGKYAAKVAHGGSFVVFKKSRPIFKICPINDGNWEEVIDFTKIKKGGVNIKEILSRI
jgi:antitoxin (DNA-binding transcriptional repressor) of toxin-antitoxin stability system